MKQYPTPQPRPGALTAPHTPLSHWVEECTKSLKGKTFESYRSLLGHLEQFLGHKPRLSDIASPEACLQFTDWLLQRVQVSSARTYLTKFYALLKRAHKAGCCQFDPSHYDELRLPRLPHKDPVYLTTAQVFALEKTSCPHPSTKQAFLFAIHSGLRLSDIETLLWEHIHVEHGRVMLVKVQVKTGNVVRVPLNDKAVAILQELSPDLQPSAKRLNDKVFALMSRTTIATDLKRWAQSAGLELHLTFHVSRHTFVTILLQSHLDIYTASRFCGHKKVATTERYAHLTDSLYDTALRSVNRYWSTVQLE